MVQVDNAYLKTKKKIFHLDMKVVYGLLLFSGSRIENILHSASLNREQQTLM